ncbi:MAG TPA: hydroxymethylbilane synthase [Alphaproteobacteria bacterium]|nr:hydroxymethylbilane synthase [Alphaproteobacteria bacterium]
MESQDPDKRLRLGTRGSPLALAQTNMVRARLIEADESLTAENTEIVTIKTSGDLIQDRPLADVGGKGLFTKEIEEALLDGSIDIAVHSMKDMPTEFPGGLTVPCILEREDPRDAFLSPGHPDPWSLPEGAMVGTSSLRRQAQLLHRRPDLKVVNFRGNVHTRLRKLRDGEVDATLLALAGLKRLGMADAVTGVIEADDLLPAVAQGAIGIECRDGDQRVLDGLASLNDDDTFDCVAAERAVLAALDGSCRTPIAALAELDGDALHLRALIVTPDGKTLHRSDRTGPRDAAKALGGEAGEALRALGGENFFSAGG